MLSFTEGEEKYNMDKYLASLADAKFTNLGSNSQVRIVGWDLSPGISHFQYEGIVTEPPLKRAVVDQRSIAPGKKNSGKICS